jgi:KUP system potassium uptake protein
MATGTRADRRAGARSAAGPSLVVGALGVVFGDIGTSPIYTVQTVFNPTDPHPVPVSADNLYGVISLVLWAVTLIVTVTYVLLVMRADNDGEGGILALITLLRRRPPRHSRARTAVLLAGLGIFGASLFLGDSIITPAISVLSAVEGLKVVEPSLADAVVPVTAVIIVLLFLAQRRGTGAVGRVFGPVMIVWFAVVAGLGLHAVAGHPAILRALSPTYALGFLFGDFKTAFFSLAAVVLAVTGAEALYADMGHFGRGPIRLSWLAFVFPALALNYLGQGAVILDDPANAGSPFFLLAPDWGRLPLVLLATAATVIASQAVITGAFSVASQASQLGYLPRLRVEHTSRERFGQIYVPWINWVLMVSVLTLVLAFRSSASLAYAYGVAVTGTITITTVLFFYVARTQWSVPLWLVVLGGGLLVGVDLLFLAANLTKLTHGAWLPLLIAVTTYTVLTTWQRGRELVTHQRERAEGSLAEFVDDLREQRPPVMRVEGTAVFLNRGKTTAPLAMRATVEHSHVLHEHVVIVAIETQPVPRVPDHERLVVDDLGHRDDGIAHVTARFGYMDEQRLPAALGLLRPEDVTGVVDAQEASYYLSLVQLIRGEEPTMPQWRKRLFIATSRITADAAEHFALPADRTVIMGARIEV